MAYRFKIAILFVFHLISFFPLHAANLPDLYIQSYAQVAIEEMQKSGIPASIKLAQGLLESDWGRSPLANKANNHFGIKCGSNWSGKSFYVEDDDYDRAGKKVPSCFRYFDDAVMSYRAHTDFLRDPSKEGRYGFLFNYKSTDYKQWAHGLKKAGYATDPNYPKKLIEIIERYQLYQYDLEVGPMIVEDRQTIAKNTDKAVMSNEMSSSKEYSGHRYRKINGLRVFEYQGSETVKSIAQKLKVSPDEILKHNEILSYEYQEVPENTPIYLEKKKREFEGIKTIHTVESGETMEVISQMYGVRLATLYALNRMKEGQVPKPGEKISLKDKVGKSERPKVLSENSKKGESKFLFD